MTREEAIEVIKRTKGAMVYTEKEKEALETLIPELAESDDERMLRTIIKGFESWKSHGNSTFNNANVDDILAYLEKQKDSASNNFDDVWNEEDCEEIIAEGQKLTPRFKELLKEVCHAWYDRGAKLEKQGEASKAIEAVERIDKYIDENLANAHDMKDSNPDKKYYRGWDDALGEMSRILQDVYSVENQKERKEETLRDFIDNFPYSAEQEEQKPVEWEWPNLSNCIRNCKKCHGKCLYRKELYEEQKPAEKHDLVAQLKEHLANATKEQLETEWKELEKWNNIGPTVEEYLGGIKPVEWSHEDDNHFHSIYHYLRFLKEDSENEFVKNDIEKNINWFCRLYQTPPKQDKQEWSEKDEKMRERLITGLTWITYNTRTDSTSPNITFFDEINWLKSLPLNLKKKNEDIAKLCSNEWSEEDKEMLRTVIYDLERHDRDAYAVEIKWLKCLDERFNLQPKQEWSEEDETRLTNTLIMLKEYAIHHYSKDDVEKSVDWLENRVKSFLSQYHGDVTMTEAYKMGKEAGEASHWKPTEHQMTILKAVKEYVGKGSGYWGEGLGSLINDLEKL